MRAIVTTLAALLGAAFAPAQSREALDADARAYLALAAVRDYAAAQSAPDMTRAVGYHDAVAWTHLTHRPALVSVGLDCSALCSRIRPEIPTAHAQVLAGDATPHMQLILAGDDGRLWASGERWAYVPREEEIRAAAKALAEFVAGPGGRVQTSVPAPPAIDDCPGVCRPRGVTRW